MRAHQLMSRNVITIGDDASVIAAIQTMLSHHISGLPVLDATGKLVGILSEGDFVRRAELGTEKKQSRLLALLANVERDAIDFVRQRGRKVGQIMSPRPITIGENTTLEQIVRLMESHNVKRFPVMRGQTIVGMVTRRDFMTALSLLPLGTMGYSNSDDQIRKSVVAAISHAPWRPCGLNVTVRDGIVTLRGTVKSENVRKAVHVAAENIAGVTRVEDELCKVVYPPPEEDYGGGDFVSLQEEPSTADDQPL